jgi:hypothetical protein
MLLQPQCQAVELSNEADKPLVKQSVYRDWNLSGEKIPPEKSYLNEVFNPKATPM